MRFDNDFAFLLERNVALKKKGRMLKRKDKVGLFLKTPLE
jgi:hypothetical protein